MFYKSTQGTKYAQKKYYYLKLTTKGHGGFKCNINYTFLPSRASLFFISLLLEI
jgi:hypothetical protein